MKIRVRYSYTDGSNYFLADFDINQVANGYPFDVLSDNPLKKNYKLSDTDLFIGLHDQNRKRIFVSDILKIQKKADSKPIVGKVVYYPQMAGFILSFKDEEGKSRFVELEPDYCDGEYLITWAEVIGNVYQNPDLL